MTANVETMFYTREKQWHGLGERVEVAPTSADAHAKPLRRTANYHENLFARTVEGNPLIDRAYQMVCGIRGICL